MFTSVPNLFILKMDDMLAVKSYDLNTDAAKDDESYNMFDVAVIHDTEQKMFGIPYRAYFEWMFENDKKAMRYIKKLVKKGYNDIDIIHDLDSLGYDWKGKFQAYIDELFVINHEEPFWFG